jgi:hypothetical protein
MVAVPILSSALLTQGLRDFYHSRRKHYLVAVYGAGVSEELTLELTATATQKPLPKVRVIPVASELELRQRMPPVEEALPCIAFLVPFTEDLPSDLAGRFANSGRVRALVPIDNWLPSRALRASRLRSLRVSSGATCSKRQIVRNPIVRARLA